MWPAPPCTWPVRCLPGPPGPRWWWTAERWRKAVGDSGDAQKLIRTIARKGIRFVGDVRVEGGGGPSRAGGLADDVGERSRQAPSLPDRPAIAVLPFTNMTDDSAQEYFSDGISEDIITALSKLRSFSVIARNSSFIYKGKSVHIKRVADELGVGYVVEGSVRRAGDRVRITAQLNDVSTGSHIWAEHYDRNITDVFAVQDEITESIVAAIAPQLYAAEGFRARRKPPDALGLPLPRRAPNGRQRRGFGLSLIPSRVG